MQRDFTNLGNFVVGLVLRQIAYPDPFWDPAAHYGELIEQRIRPPNPASAGVLATGRPAL